MNSPVCHIAGPNTNMIRTRKKLVRKKITSKSTSQPKPASQGRMSLQAAAAYGATIGPRKQLPLMAGAAGSLVVTNYERIGAVTGNGSFAATSARMNPGDSAIFPWLSSIALNYMKFRWKFLRFIYVPSTPSSTTGSAFVFLNYDYLDAAPSTLTQVTTTSDSSTGNVWFGGPIDEGSAFKPALTASDAINVTARNTEYSQDWYYVRNAANAETLATIQFGSTTNTGAITVGQNGGSLVPIVTGGSSTLVTIPDPSARPVSLVYGCDSVTNALVVGNIYCAYQAEFCNPVASASQN
jgi:hypothetical protein